MKKINNKNEKEEIKHGNSEAAEESLKTIKKSAGIPNKKKRKLLVPVLLFISVLVVCFCVYGGVGFSYQDKFLPGTWINGIDCSELNAAQVAGLVDNQLRSYDAVITGRDPHSGTSGTVIGQFTAEEIHLTYSEDWRDEVEALLEKQNTWTWLYRKMSDDTYSNNLVMGVSYDTEALNSIVNSWEACQPDNMVSPQDSYVDEYSDRLKRYEIVPEIEGTKMDLQRLLELIDTMIISHETSLDLETNDCYEKPRVRQNDTGLTEAVETANKWLETKVTYDWNGAEVVVDSELLEDWIVVKNNNAVLDEKAVAAFVKEQAQEYDTYGNRRNFVTTLGVELSLPSGYYGWLTDIEEETKELIELIHQGKSVTKEPIYASAARQKGMSDIGNSYVEADLTHQHLYLYENGAVVFETDFVSGNMSNGCETPEGVFGLTYKTTNAVLRGPGYATPVNYWMPFYGDFGMHDATWRGEFGGQIYIADGSHGCLNLPLDAAALLYEHVSTGFPVICYYYQVDPLADQYVETDWEEDDDEE